MTGTDPIIATYEGNSATFTNLLYLMLDGSGQPGDDGDLTKGIESGTSGPRMAEFLNGKAWLWTYVYEDVERDPDFKAKLERAVGLCSQSALADWHRAVSEAKERHPAVMELRRRYYW